jgi:hypothetical protein
MLEVSMPVIFNNSNGVFYSLGNRRESSGKAVSFGLGVNYSRYLSKNFFLKGGIGYFKQSFNIIRPFEFNGDTISNLLYSTKKYQYHCIGINAALGYSHDLNKNLKLNGAIAFNVLNSYRQTYNPNGLDPLIPKPDQINTKSERIGYSANVSVGLEYYINRHISIGADISIPVVTQWKDDEIFINSQFGNDARIIAENRYSIGTAVSCKYYF